MKMKIFFSLFVIFFISACSNKLLDNYIETYNSNLEYGNINKDGEVINKVRNINIKTLNVGLFLPLSGKLEYIGNSLLNSAELSIFDNNKNNLFLNVYDTKGTTFGAIDAMNNAIKDGVDVIIGPLLSEETRAISDLAEKNDIIVFSLSNDQKLKNTTNVFVSGSILEQEIELLLSTLINNSITNFVAYLPNNAYGSLVNDILKEKLKAKDANLIKVDFYNATGEDQMFDNKLVSLVNSYKASEEYLAKYEENKANGKATEFLVNDEDKIKPQVLFIADGGNVAEKVGLSLYKFKEKLDNPNIQLAGLSKLEGDKNVMENPYLDKIIFVGSDSEKYKEFEDKYYKVYKAYPTKVASIVYDLVNTVDNFFKKQNGVFAIDKEELLYPFGYNGIDGKFRFLPNGLVERNMFILQNQNKQKVLIDTNQEFLNY